ncbi:MAG: hypothetical protein ACD_2C00036G0001 [uncultured bacterium (gcode 4)]|uniref:Uncharacterized protein n=1 Tax=uncultured bacterium (gcode 4) TaxID=1234023 RepID=K2FGB6_9BACT|nr:MAG: hypothetical protein ACD_2C00036G0001 [uncultured bacterium (gcode 4)]
MFAQKKSSIEVSHIKRDKKTIFATQGQLEFGRKKTKKSYKPSELQMRFFDLKSWFTLIELLVIVIILSILWIIALVAYLNYQSASRDALRIAAIRNIHKWLVLQNIQSWEFPTPDDYLEVVWVWKQWYIWDNIKNIIGIGWSWKDPRDDSFYIYNLDVQNRKIQISWFLEVNNRILFSSNYGISSIQAYAWEADYSDRFIYTVWDRVWVLLDESKVPINLQYSSWSIDLASDSGSYTAVFTNSMSDSWTISGSGLGLLTQISIVQNSCILWNSYVINWSFINSYNSPAVAYDQTCIPLIRKCTNWFLDWDQSYVYDSCSPATALNCSATWSGWYDIPAIDHNSSRNITKPISGWIADISITCSNWNLWYWSENINCAANYVLDGWECKEDICQWSAPDFSIANWIQKFNIPWMHNANPWQCTFICQAGYYWNNSGCAAASAWYYVSDVWSVSQTSCWGAEKYQDLTWQASCKEAQPWYYTTWWTWPSNRTWQVICEENNYCSDWLKMPCSVWYSSPAWSSSPSACIINMYNVSWSFWADWIGATINVCGINVMADTVWNFSVNREYWSVCNNISATRIWYTCSTTTNGPASLTGNFSSVAGSCTLNSYTVSGSFWANANGATISVCWTNVTADTSGNFTATRNYWSVCNTITATRAGYTCSTTVNWPSSLTWNYPSVAGSCSINSYTVSGSFWANANGATVNVCWTSTTANSSWNFSVSRNHWSVCNNISATRTWYSCNTTTNGPASLSANFSSVAGSCSINSYTVSGSFWANANWATVNVCWTNVTADASGNFTATRNYWSACNTITATRAGYTCSTTVNWPSSLTWNYPSVAGSCSINSYTVSGSFWANANGATVNVCWTNVTANSSWIFTASKTFWSVCNAISATRVWYACSTTANWPSSLSSDFTTVAWSCTLNSYTVSGSFWTNANGATISICWSSTTANSSGFFTISGIPHWTDCNNLTATRLNYTCSTTVNWPSSLTASLSNLVWSCSPNTKTFTCANTKPANTIWNSVASYAQTWNWTAWSPADSTTAYNAAASSSGCRYACAAWYHTENSWVSCISDTKTFTCSNSKPVNSSWNTVSSYTQTWGWTAWSPGDSTTAYNTTASSISCRYKCSTWYHSENSWVSCISNTKTFTCPNTKPANTVWNSVPSYSQSWNWTAWTPADSTTVYNTAASSNSCRYTCATWYHTENSWASCVPNVCASNPSFANLWTLTVWTPSVNNQGWAYSMTPWSCTYSCSYWYGGTGCSDFTYPWCNAADIHLWNWQIWAACNIWTSISGLTNASYGYYYQWWINDNSYVAWRNTGSWPLKWQWPCAAWYHVPSIEEWTAACASIWWGTCTSSAALATSIRNTLKTPMAGTYPSAYSWSYYWTSSPRWETTANFFRFSDSVVDYSNFTGKEYGLNVRCLRN